MIEQLYDGEQFFIWVNRSFGFLRLGYNGYVGNEFLLNGLEQSWVSYYRHSRRKKVTIIENENGDLDFWVETKGLFGVFWRRKTLKDYFGSDVKVQSIRRLAEMVKGHEGLMKELVG